MLGFPDRSKDKAKDASHEQCRHRLVLHRCVDRLLEVIRDLLRAFACFTRLNEHAVCRLFNIALADASVVYRHIPQSECAADIVWSEFVHRRNDQIRTRVMCHMTDAVEDLDLTVMELKMQPC